MEITSDKVTIALTMDELDVIAQALSKYEGPFPDKAEEGELVNQDQEIHERKKEKAAELLDGIGHYLQCKAGEQEQWKHIKDTVMSEPWKGPPNQDMPPHSRFNI